MKLSRKQLRKMIVEAVLRESSSLTIDIPRPNEGIKMIELGAPITSIMNIDITMSSGVGMVKFVCDVPFRLLGEKTKKTRPMGDFTKVGVMYISEPFRPSQRDEVITLGPEPNGAPITKLGVMSTIGNR